MINERIKHLRNDLNLTLVQFGERIGLNNSTLSMIERNQRAVTDRTIKLICSEFGVSENWLRTGEGEMLVETTQDERISDIIFKRMNSGNDNWKKLIKEAEELTEDELKLLLAVTRTIKNAKKTTVN